MKIDHPSTKDSVLTQHGNELVLKQNLSIIMHDNHCR